MKSARRRRVLELFEEALDLPESERGTFVVERAAGDADLADAVGRLLAADAEPAELLDRGLDPSLSLPDFDEQLLTAQHIGPYRILRVLGESGMSRVLLGVRDDDEFEQLVAVKVVRARDRTDLVRRFRMERQILASLDHPNVAKLLDGGTTDEGLLYFVMDYIDGLPIDRYCDVQRLSVDERLELFRQVCDAVQYAHQSLVVHRDIKPTNILVTADGEVRLLDFGIAKLLRPEQFASPIDVTRTAVRPMTPVYASPEQIHGKLVTTSTDVYSLGVLLYRLLTGYYPYRLEVADARSLESAVLEQDPVRASVAVQSEATFRLPGRAEDVVSPSAVAQARSTTSARLARELAGDLDAILSKALRKEPQKRYTTVAQLAEDLRRHGEDLPVRAHRGSVTYQARRFIRRNRVAVTVFALFTALVTTFGLWMGAQAREMARQRDATELQRQRAEHVVEFLQDLFRISDPISGGEVELSGREIIDLGARRVQTELSDQPEVRATLLETIGNVYANLGAFDRAEPLFRSAIEFWSGRPEERSAAIRNRSSLGRALLELGRFDEAQALLEDTLAAIDTDPSLDPGLRILPLHWLGKLHHDGGRWAAAERAYAEALTVQRATGATEDLQVFVDFAIFLSEMDEPSRAEPLFHEGLNKFREVLGEEHVKVAETLGDFGVFYGMQGRLAEAEPLLREALAKKRVLLTDAHPGVAEAYNNLARMLVERGELEEAVTLFGESVARLDATGAGNSPRALIYRHNLGTTLYDLRRYDEAESVLGPVVDGRRKLLDPSSPYLSVSLVRLGATLNGLGRPAAGLALIEEADRSQESLPAGHRFRLATELHRAESLALLGRLDEAEPLLTAAVSSCLEPGRTQKAHRRRCLKVALRFYEASERSDEVERYRRLLAELG